MFGGRVPIVRTAAFAAALALLATVAAAAPYTPESDGVVLERLPERGDPALAQLKRMRATLAGNPRQVDLAVSVARRALDAARALGDPRFLGQAQAALGPWWSGSDVPASAWLLRATLKQAQHDFAGSLQDLDALLAAHPTLAQARLTRATVLSVVGRYADARHDCDALAGHAPALVVIGCEAVPASLTGNTAPAYEALMQALSLRGGDPGVREWVLTLAAEIAARRGDIDAAERHFRDALALDPRDPYLKAAYADFLLDRDRAVEVVPLLRDDTRNDALLLRLTLAEQRLPEAHASFAIHRDELAARFDDARRRGDSLHRREEARFRLVIERDPESAVRLARDNWAVQREPADLRILLEASRAAGDADALAIGTRFIAANRIEDATLQGTSERR
jgi:tetratricopeptide (TPR) repeat protein